jgi:hypothetical protein
VPVPCCFYCYDSEKLFKRRVLGGVFFRYQLDDLAL